VRKAEEGLFIEMAELLPSYLDSVELNTGKQSRSRRQLPEVSDIVEWIQCFRIYMAIISRSRPKCMADLIGYQSMLSMFLQPKGPG